MDIHAIRERYKRLITLAFARDDAVLAGHLVLRGSREVRRAMRRPA